MEISLPGLRSWAPGQVTVKGDAKDLGLSDHNVRPTGVVLGVCGSSFEKQSWKWQHVFFWWERTLWFEGWRNSQRWDGTWWHCWPWMISQIVSVPKVRVSLPTLSCPPNRTETSPQVWFFPKPPSAGYSLDDITAESRANAARLNTTEGNFFCFIGAGSLKDKSVAQSFTGVDQLPEFPRFFFLNWGRYDFWGFPHLPFACLTRGYQWCSRAPAAQQLTGSWVHGAAPRHHCFGDDHRRRGRTLLGVERCGKSSAHSRIQGTQEAAGGTDGGNLAGPKWKAAFWCIFQLGMLVL